MRILGEPETPEQKEQQIVERLSPGRMLLIAVVIVTGVFSYIYFFTDLIRIHEEPQPDHAPLQRKPLPVKSGGQSPISSARHIPTGSREANPDTSPPAGPLSIPPVPPASADQKKQEVLPLPESKPAPVVPAATSSAGAVPEQKRTPPAPAAPSPVTPVTAKVSPAGKTPVRSAVPVAAQPAATPKPKAAAVPVTPPVTPAPESAKSAKPVSEKGSYLVQCGPVVSEGDLTRVRNSAQKANLTVTVVPGAAKLLPMYRLFVAGYSDAATAGAEREKLLKMRAAAFVLLKDGNHELYAGSFREEARATKEQSRLAGMGTKVQIQQVPVPVTSRRLTVAGFSTHEAAVAFSGRINKQGIECSVVKRGR